jgi:hypothetical protein
MENKMKRLFLGISILMLISVMNPFKSSGNNEEQEIRNSLQQYFSVLKSGDVSAIESAIGGDLLEEMKVLLRKNKEYGQFLRNYYQEAEFQLAKIVPVSGGIIADVNVVFSNQDSQQYNFFLKKEQADKSGDGGWKVIRQDLVSPRQ